jgi:uncharacterized delta-60 repeat protein
VLDPAFDGDGVVTHALAVPFLVRGVAVQPDRRIVVVGAAGPDMFALRLREDGSLDTTFGGTGFVTVDFGGGDWANDVALRASDGAIVMVGGTDAVGSGAIALAVLRSDGLPDPTLNGNGRMTIDGTTADDDGRAVAVQLDDRMVVAAAGHASGSTTNFLLYRALPNGTLDIGADTMNGTGPATVTWGYDDEVLALALDPIDGDIVLAGTTNANFPETDFAVARFLPHGVIDPSFDGDGKQTIDISGYDEASGVQVDFVGRVLVTGFSEGPPPPPGGGPVAYGFSGVRLTPTGGIDSTWNPVPVVPPNPDGQGRLFFQFPNSDLNRGRASLLQPDGKLVLAGYTGTGFPVVNGALVRRDAQGLPDGTFGTAGASSYDVPGQEYITSAARDDLGRLIMAGEISTDGGLTFQVVVMRVGG